MHPKILALKSPWWKFWDKRQQRAIYHYNIGYVWAIRKFQQGYSVERIENILAIRKQMPMNPYFVLGCDQAITVYQSLK